MVVARASDEQILAFLEEAKRLVCDRKFKLIPRGVNLQALAQFNLTIPDVKDEILTLEIGHYYSGPKRDFDREGVIWEFEKDLDGFRFYIKLKIDIEEGERILKCLSFHESDFA